MSILRMISETYRAWRWRRDAARWQRDAARELSQFSDRDLLDIGIRRCDMEDIIYNGGLRRADA
jgi:uncharacterized protein YjiS (DUF1127 family)